MGEPYRPSPDQIIESRIGTQGIEHVASTTRQLFDQIKTGLRDICIGEGSTSQQQEKAREYLDMWREFSNAVFARTSSANVKSPEILQTAIKGATALMKPEIERESRGDVRKMIDALERRYGKS
jgi:hypothetical protein